MLIDKLYEAAVDLLNQLIAIPSFSKSEEGSAELIYQFLKGQGVIAGQLQNNVWAVNKHFDTAKPTILLNSHHDLSLIHI